MHSGYTNCSSKTGWISTPKRKNDDFEAPFKKNFKRKINSAKMKKKLVPKHHSQLSCCHYITIYDPQLQNTIVLRTHPQQRETLMQPFHWDLQRLELPNTIEVQRTTVEHIALMHQFQCTKCLNTCKTK